MEIGRDTEMGLKETGKEIKREMGTDKKWRGKR
jgi:hypothetical protein